MPIPRFFVEHTDIDILFRSLHMTGWQVFDREKASMLNLQGRESFAICFCRDRREAFAIRDALNSTTKRT